MTERGFARTGRNQDLACEIKVEAALIIDSEHVALRVLNDEMTTQSPYNLIKD